MRKLMKAAFVLTLVPLLLVGTGCSDADSNLKFKNGGGDSASLVYDSQLHLLISETEFAMASVLGYEAVRLDLEITDADEYTSIDYYVGSDKDSATQYKASPYGYDTIENGSVRYDLSDVSAGLWYQFSYNEDSTASPTAKISWIYTSGAQN